MKCPGTGIPLKFCTCARHAIAERPLQLPPDKPSELLPIPPADDPLATTIRQALDGQRLGIIVEEHGNE